LLSHAGQEEKEISPRAREMYWSNSIMFFLVIQIIIPIIQKLLGTSQLGQGVAYPNAGQSMSTHPAIQITNDR